MWWFMIDGYIIKTVMGNWISIMQNGWTVTRDYITGSNILKLVKTNIATLHQRHTKVLIQRYAYKGINDSSDESQNILGEQGQKLWLLMPQLLGPPPQQFLCCCLHAGLSGIPWQTTWWRHQLETFSALLALCAGNSPVTGELSSQRPVTRSFDIWSLICAWNKQPWGWWFETLSRSLWRLCNAELSSYPGYFWETHWFSMGLPETSRVTW